MLSSARQDRIIEILNEKKQITTQELEEMFEVSAATIRNDLKKLEKEGFLKRVHGGAVLPENEFSQTGFTFHTRSEKNVKEKEAIGKEAAKLIEDNCSLLLDASSTVLYLIPFLKDKKRLTVVTNGLYTALKAKELPNINTILLGGMVRAKSGAIEGLLGEEMLAKVNSKVMLTSAHGFTLEEGLLDFNFYEVQLKQKMLEHSQKLIALLDHTKIGNSSATSFASPEKIDIIITDDKTPIKKIKEIEKLGIEVLIAC